MVRPDKPSLASQTLRAYVAQRAYDLTIPTHAAGAPARETLTINGKAADCSWASVSDGYVSLLLDGRSIPAVIESFDDGRLRVTVEGHRIEVQVKDEKDLLLERFGLDAGAGNDLREIRAPMPGLVLNIAAEVGQPVKAGAGLVVLEAMKMENELRAPADGVIKAVHVIPGEAVAKNALLIEFET